MIFYDEFTKAEIDDALNHAFHNELDQKHYDILLSVCRFAKKCKKQICVKETT